ncbi:ThiF family adenylyltransferase [Microbacterium panaciterrae]|uniref:ThiF family adenylyltransferase n=1 Tax=Microbacterium panaciterrae TaxID=985759 RepID=A0ABP8P5Y2_9MICO
MNWDVVITGEHWQQLRQHLFPGDHQEHGAILRCGYVETTTHRRLLVREVIPANEVTDYLPGRRSNRTLTADFIAGNALQFAEDGSAYLAVHCHGGDDRVAFSETDLRSHEHGYPGLLQLIGGPAVGALVFAVNSVAGDLWTPDGQRHTLDKLIITDPQRTELTATPRPDQPIAEQYNRQGLMFGRRGQQILANQKIAIIGLGGAGSLINQMTARLGVGHVLLIDSDRVDESNLSRVVGATRFDAHTWLTRTGNPGWVRRLGERLSSTKVRVAARVARRASPSVTVETVSGNVEDPGVAERLRDCDHIFLAADSHTARHVVNAIAHQYLVPVTQLGAKVTVGSVTGELTSVFSVSRLIVPGQGCLWCNGLISRSQLTDEGKSEADRVRQRYVDGEDVHAPSVITLNSIAASFAVNEWLLRTVGVAHRVGAPEWVHVDSLNGEVLADVTRKDPDCRWCGPARFGVGDAKPLPVKRAATK